MNLNDLKKWSEIGGDYNLRLDYNLNENSLVIDLGGYHGEWSDKISNRYNPNIIIFEPIPYFYNSITEKFKNNPKIKVINSGVSDKNKISEICLLNDGSSFYTNFENKITVDVLSFCDFIRNNQINKVDLIKINIEGDEYPVLTSLIENNLIDIFTDIQVQFHQFIPDSINLRNEIRNKLSLTHDLTYDYEFVWENWRKKQ
jgi:FkbM family methyltransferase